MQANKILIIDDQQDFRDILKDILQSAGYVVLEAGSGQEAISLLEKEQDNLSIIFLDIEMPEMDGYKVLEEIKPCCLQKDIKICFLTARDTKEDVLKAISMGVAGYITKPTEKEIVLAKVKNILCNDEAKSQKHVASFKTNLKAEVTDLPVQLEVNVVEVSVTGLKFRSLFAFKPQSNIIIHLEEFGSLDCCILSCIKKSHDYVCCTSFINLKKDIAGRINSICRLFTNNC